MLQQSRTNFKYKGFKNSRTQLFKEMNNTKRQSQKQIGLRLLQIQQKILKRFQHYPQSDRKLINKLFRNEVDRHQTIQKKIQFLHNVLSNVDQDSLFRFIGRDKKHDSPNKEANCQNKSFCEEETKCDILHKTTNLNQQYRNNQEPSFMLKNSKSQQMINYMTKKYSSNQSRKNIDQMLESSIIDKELKKMKNNKMLREIRMKMQIEQFNITKKEFSKQSNLGYSSYSSLMNTLQKKHSLKQDKMSEDLEFKKQKNMSLINELKQSRPSSFINENEKQNLCEDFFSFRNNHIKNQDKKIKNINKNLDPRDRSESSHSNSLNHIKRKISKKIDQRAKDKIKTNNLITYTEQSNLQQEKQQNSSCFFDSNSSFDFNLQKSKNINHLKNQKNKIKDKNKRVNHKQGQIHIDIKLNNQFKNAKKSIQKRIRLSPHVISRIPYSSTQDNCNRISRLFKQQQIQSGILSRSISRSISHEKDWKY